MSAESEPALRRAVAFGSVGGGTVTQHLPTTVTVARLLAEQGHVASAREVLAVVLERSPGDPEAANLVRLLEKRRDVMPRNEPAEEVLAPPEPGDPASIAASFRATLGGRPGQQSGSVAPARLRVLLDRIRENRHEPAR